MGKLPCRHHSFQYKAFPLLVSGGSYCFNVASSLFGLFLSQQSEVSMNK